MKRLPILVDRHLAARAVAIAAMVGAIAWSMYGISPGGHVPAAAPRVMGPLPIGVAAGPIPEPLFPQTNMPAATNDGFEVDGPPELLGLAGRLPDDVEVLIRNENGRTSALRVGQSAMGWELVSVASDRAVFERDGEQMIRMVN